MSHRWTLLVLLIASSIARLHAAAPPSMAAQAGAETLAKIQSSFFMPDRSLYALEIDSGKPLHPSWIWDASIQLGALCAAARLEPREYLPRVKAYAAALRSYRTTYHDRPGLDVNPPPKPADRYYDDNAWICISLLEACDLTHDPRDMALAMDAYNFTLSGEDSILGGGMYWHEDQTKSKNACSSGPAMLAALKLYQITSDRRYFETARRLYAWTLAHLQDQDGLVFDSISVPAGAINKSKFTYNSATLLHAACILYGITHEQRYLDEAQRVARAAERRFVREEDGVITGSGKLGVKLVEACLALYETDRDDHWRQLAGRCLTAVRRHQNAAGWYAQDWQAAPLAPGKPVRLIDQSAAARAYWIAAEHGVEMR